MTSDRTCSVDECDRPVVARGWCTLHYSRWRRTGKPGAAAPQRNRKRNIGCSVDGCPDPFFGHGLCSKHLQRLVKTGTTDDPVVLTTLERFLGNFAEGAPDACWLWTGTIDPEGYGSFATSWPDGRDRHERAHRFSFAHFVGPIVYTVGV